MKTSLDVLTFTNAEAKRVHHLAFLDLHPMGTQGPGLAVAKLRIHCVHTVACRNILSCYRRKTADDLIFGFRMH